MDIEKILQSSIEDNEYNRKLMALYTEVFSKDTIDFIESYNSDPNTDLNTIVANPQLPTISNSFMNSQCRIIHFGDETNGWGGEDPDRNGHFNPALIPKFLMKLYETYKSKAEHKGEKISV